MGTGSWSSGSSGSSSDSSSSSSSADLGLSSGSSSSGSGVSSLVILGVDRFDNALPMRLLKFLDRALPTSKGFAQGELEAVMIQSVCPLNSEQKGS